MIKIDPKCIGVGQYQHDVNQTLLRRGLDREVEACVNSVGVDVNMASGSLLAHVAGIGPKLAERIVEHRDGHGRFENRERLLDVPKLGSKVFEQAAGFLRIRDGQQPLDNSAVHPESYRVVEKMAAKLGVPTSQLVGNATLAAKLDDREFVDEQFGLPTVEDILGELAKPGRDPRSEFKVARFAEGINNLEDLKARMILEGVITNNNQLKHADPLRFVAADVQGKPPCLLVAPQNPEGLWPGKSSQLAMEILDSLAEKYSIDADRRFVTGLSSGGMGTYYCLVERPDYFAAGAPICRRGDTSKTELIAKIPVWGFCGDKDDFAASMRAMNDAVKKAGGNWKYTEYPGVGHNSWGLAYATEDLQAWLFAQSRIKE